MLAFECDYVAGAHPEILKKLMETNLEPMPGYGADRFSLSAKEKIKAACGLLEGEVELLVGGTQTNALVISTMLKGHEGVIACDSGHIGVHEGGAIEYAGFKVLTLPGQEGKLLVEDLRAYVEAFYSDVNREHMVFPGMVYISYPTEYGTLYTREELKAIYEICRRYEMTFYIDGARLGYGLMSPACDLTLPELCRLCDVLYIGGTKVGALCGEAVVFTKNNRPPHFMTLMKKRGALLAKGRLLGIQFDTLFTDHLYFEISRHAMEMAQALKELFQRKGYEFYLNSPTNQQFILLDNQKIAELQGKVTFDFWGPYDEKRTIVRFATSWSTTRGDLEELAKLL